MRLDVLIERHHAGHVDIFGEDKAVLGYAESYLALPEPTPLSVRFPLREEPYDTPQVAYWLQNLLPDDRDVLARWCDRFGASPMRPIELLGTGGRGRVRRCGAVLPAGADRGIAR